MKLIDAYALLLHRVTETDRYAIILQGVMVYRNTIRGTDRILTAITLTNRILLVVLATEVETQHIYNLLSFLGQAIFLHQWQYGQLDRSQGCGQLQYHTALAIRQCLLAVRTRHDAQEHTVYTDRGLDYIRSVTLVQLRIEILDLFTGKLLMLTQVEIRTAMDRDM